MERKKYKDNVFVIRLMTIDNTV